MSKRNVPRCVSCPICGFIFLSTRSRQKFCSWKCQRANVAKEELSRVKTYNSHTLASESRKIPLSPIQKEVVYGTLLGDGCLTTTGKGYEKYLLRFTHCARQEDYLRFKIKILSNIFLGKIHISDTRESIVEGRRIFSQQSFRAYSIYHDDLTSINSILYYRADDGHRVKKITEEYLNLLTPTSLLFWYLDDGTINKLGTSIGIATRCFSLEENILISSWFKNTYDIDIKIDTYLTPSRDGGKNKQFSIRLNKDSTIQFLSILRTSPLYQVVPECVHYKL